MKKLQLIGTLLLSVLMLAPATMNAQDKKKKKKAKKEFVWDWNHEKSGNETVDEYLLACDTLWNDITKYQENITSYLMKEDTIMVDGKIYTMAHMETAEGSLLTKGAANWQLVESIGTGVTIVANSVQIAAQTASATMALPSLGLKALSYGKYVKAGPNIIAKGGKEIKEIVVMRKMQMSKWKAMRKDAIDPATLNLGMDEETLKKFAKSYFIKELKAEETGYNEVKTVFDQKTPEQIEQEAKDFADNVANKTVLPEEAGQTIDDSDEAFMKEVDMPEEA